VCWECGCESHREGMVVCFLWVLCVVRYRSLRRADPLFRLVCVCMFLCHLCVIRCNRNPLHWQWIGRRGQTRKKKWTWRFTNSRVLQLKQSYLRCIPNIVAFFWLVSIVWTFAQQISEWSNYGMRYGRANGTQRKYSIQCYALLFRKRERKINW
jgi:hypothetical protein